ncbi:LysR family transcriptional regulator [Rhizobium mesosinicum]|uniref:LysR family transcriptional regulator n=1 Tax=Rhizobium mesosinicum TaxID=335017 RepID=A0ABS7GM84_9HYPH|nr:LysR family transcriptional regulator [Rhizobium mesosinicum]MBW9051090.1 LysR family transcriptional regulator [Rhizobium mesosinicum]
MDRLKAMEVFVRVAETGSLSKAAQTLGVPRSSVTMTLQRLEKYLGVRLLQRTTRSLGLTEDGRAYYERCSQILSEVEATEQSLRHSLKAPKGRLRVDMPGSIATSVILPRIAEFRKEYPGIEIALGLNDRRVDLIQEGVDCVIRTGSLGDSSLIARKIGSYRWITCAAPAYLAKQGVPETPTDLTEHAVVGYFSGSPGQERWAYGIEGQLLETVPVKSEIAVNETSAYLRLGLDGLGIIRLADYIVEPHLKDGSLVEVLSQYATDEVPISVLYPTSRHLSPTVRLFVDWVSGLFVGPRDREIGGSKKAQASLSGPRLDQ